MQSDLVFDIGANNGDDPAHYLSRGFRVVAVEANPALCDQLTSRFTNEIADRRLVVERVGIAAHPGSATFFVNADNDHHSAFDPGIASRGQEVALVNVPCVTTAALFDRHGVPYYLKADIEGREGLCLDALDPAELPQFVSVEAQRLEYLATLWAKGYRRFRVVDQTAHGAGSLPFSNEAALARLTRRGVHFGRRLQRRLGHTGSFAPASSGPMPDERDDWQSFELVAYDWLHFKRGHHDRGSLNPQGWFDFHATLP